MEYRREVAGNLGLGRPESSLLLSLPPTEAATQLHKSSVPRNFSSGQVGRSVPSMPWVFSLSLFCL